MELSDATLEVRDLFGHTYLVATREHPYMHVGLDQEHSC